MVLRFFEGLVRATVALLVGPLVAAGVVAVTVGVSNFNLLDPLWRVVDGVVPDDPVDDGFKGVVLVSMTVTAVVWLMIAGRFVTRTANGAAVVVRHLRRSNR